MLTTADILGMRETLDTSLPDTCTVVRSVLTSDSAGGQTVASTVETEYACRISPRLATGTGQLKDAEIEQGGRIVSQAPWLITLPANAIVGETDHIVSGDRRFEVFAVLGRRSNELATLVLVRNINQGQG